MPLNDNLAHRLHDKQNEIKVSFNAKMECLNILVKALDLGLAKLPSLGWKAEFETNLQATILTTLDNTPTPYKEVHTRTTSPPPAYIIPGRDKQIIPKK